MEPTSYPSTPAQATTHADVQDALAALAPSVQALQAQARQQAQVLSPWAGRSPGHQEVLGVFEQALADLQDERFETAARGFAAVSAVITDRAPVFFGLGLSLQMLGHLEAAARAYVAAYLLDPLDPACLLRLGECEAARGEPDAARDYWLTGLKLCAQRDVDPGLRSLIEHALDGLYR